MHDNDAIFGNDIAVVATSKCGTRFVPLQNALLYGLFTSPVRHAGRWSAQTLSEYKLNMIGGKITISETRAWSAAELPAQSTRNPQLFGKPMRILQRLQHAINSKWYSPFGHDLPIYMESGRSREALDWDKGSALRFDVYKGLQKQIPFNWNLHKRAKATILPEMPFVDYEHFESVVPGTVLIALTRQLVAQHTVIADQMSLIPVRWAQPKIDPTKELLLIDTRSPMILRRFDPANQAVRVGPIDAQFTKTD